MVLYFITFLYLSYFALFNITNNKLIWFCTYIFLILIVGFRHEVGGDWRSYLYHYNDMTYYTYSNIFTRGDPGYYLLNLFSFNNELSIYFVNFICAIITITGLFIFIKRLHNPWLGLAIAFPYLITVVYMGYSRQAVAISLILIAISFVNNKNFILSLFFILLAITFHKSAVLILGIIMLVQDKGKFFKYIALVIITIGTWDIFLSQHQERLWENYVEAEYESSGALIRVIMNVIPAIFLLLFRNEWKKNFDDYKFWSILALIAISSLFLVTFASTAVDRVALYIIIIQIVVFSRLPYLAKNYINPKTTTLLLVLYYFVIQYVWLVYASHSHKWVPYQNILIQDLW